MNIHYITVQVAGPVNSQAGAENMVQASLNLAVQEMHDVQNDTGAEPEQHAAAEFFLNHTLKVMEK